VPAVVVFACRFITVVPLRRLCSICGRGLWEGHQKRGLFKCALFFRFRRHSIGHCLHLRLAVVVVPPLCHAVALSRIDRIILL